MTTSLSLPCSRVQVVYQDKVVYTDKIVEVPVERVVGTQYGPGPQFTDEQGHMSRSMMEMNVGGGYSSYGMTSSMRAVNTHDTHMVSAGAGAEFVGVIGVRDMRDGEYIKSPPSWARASTQEILYGATGEGYAYTTGGQSYVTSGQYVNGSAGYATTGYTISSPPQSTGKEYIIKDV